MSLLAYLGPETMLPMTSVLAGILGFVMMFGRKAYELTIGLFRKKPVAMAPKTRARGHRPTTSRSVGAGKPAEGPDAAMADSAAS